MGKDSKPKDAGGKGKGKAKQGGSGADESASKGKGKSGKAAADGLGTCTYVKARHILSEKQGKINEAYKKLQDGWLSNGDKVPPAEFAKVQLNTQSALQGRKVGTLDGFRVERWLALFKRLHSPHKLEQPVHHSSQRMGTILSCVKEERIRRSCIQANPKFGAME
ncbi:uncharacterized protein LOC103503344 isoform X2 [Cucumis melo]|uniref:peptidylprolyl isomerase n=1 Tax=Cucumis melo TaxID=3656 RepID=A0ABM3L8M1_CUCME|nr:uncharacterized protein LOC103503344 isoform X2 [Cucumis melo]